MKRPSGTRTFACALGVLLLNLGLNATFFLPGEMPYRDSIEAGYASMARFIAAHPHPWGWNPTQYCGLPTQFTYLPGLHYLTALLVRAAPGLETDYAWRLITATFACFGPVTLFLFVWYFTRHRAIALAAALAYTLFSPVYHYTEVIGGDRGIAQLPWRLQVLVKYGEGPHNAGLTLLPLALIAVWAAATGRTFRRIFVAAVLLAAVTLINWVAALALGFCCLTMLLANFRMEKTRFRAWRLLAAAALAYLLAAFWLTPSFVETIAFNWPVDSFGYKLRWQQMALLGGLVTGLLLIRLAFQFAGRIASRQPRPYQPAGPPPAYFCFLVLTVFGFGWIVLLFYWTWRDTIPESRRYALEFELFLFLALFELLRRGLRNVSPMVNLAALGFVAWILWPGLGDAWKYATGSRAFRPFPKQDAVEYRLARWLDAQRPAGRVFASGGLRFRLNSWFDFQQVGGTFESGLRTRMPLHLAYQIETGLGSAPEREGLDAVLQLKAMGVEYVVVHGPGSKEHWHDFRNPRKFEGVLEAVHRDGGGADVVYRVPFTSLAHLVGPAELPEQPPAGGNFRALQAYGAAIDDRARPGLEAAWRSPSELQITGAVPDGMLVSVQVNYDSGWRALQDGGPIPIQPDRMGFMILQARPARAARIQLRYRGTAEQRVMAALSAAAWIGALSGLVLGNRLRKQG